MKGRTAVDIVAREARFPAGHRKGHAGYAADIAAKRAEMFASWFRDRRLTPDEVIAGFDAVPPAEFAAPYPIDPVALAGIGRSIQGKYLTRFANIRRSWAVLLEHMPELMADGAPPRDVLEMSTAHGATLEILRRQGHAVVGNDFANFLGGASGLDSRFRDVNGLELDGRRDDHGLNTGGETRNWPYRPIIDSLGLDVRLFDAGSTPYPFEDGSFDTVICMDAIEHYCHPRGWMAVVDEFLRLARESVLVIANPVQRQLVDDPDYMAAVGAFQREMRMLDRAGFRCVHAGMHRFQLTAFKLMRIGAPPRKAAARAKPRVARD